MPNPPLSLEQYADATAHVAHFSAEGMKAVLEQLGIESQSWEQSSAHWQGALRAEFDDDASPIATSYSTAFSTTKAKLDREHPKLKDVPPLVDRPAATVDSTAPFGVKALDDHALPFRGAASVVPPPQSAMEITSDEMGMTGMVAALDVEEVLPFTSGPRLSLTQYASLQAELARSPGQRQAILMRYGITSAEVLRAVETSWARRLVANDEERNQYDQLVASYTEWLAKGSPR